MQLSYCAWQTIFLKKNKLIPIKGSMSARPCPSPAGVPQLSSSCTQPLHTGVSSDEAGSVTTCLRRFTPRIGTWFPKGG